MTQFLNLDEIETTIEKVVVLNKVSHSFVPFTVEDFVNNLKEMETYSAKTDVPMSEYMSFMVSMVKRAFPTIPEGELDKLTMEKLKALTDFIKGVTEQEAVAGLTAEQEAEVKKSEGKSH